MRKISCPLIFGGLLLMALPCLSAQRPSLDNSLRFGYALRDGAVAIDPAVVFVYCPDTDTLIVHPDFAKDAAYDLTAEILPSGEWFIPGGKLITPQVAKLMIVTGSNEKAALRNLGSLEAVGLDQVAMAVVTEPGTPGEPTPVCQVKLTGYKCQAYDCSGCASGTKKSGGAMSFCTPSDKPTDTCTQTGSIKTCNITQYQNADCSGAVIMTSATNFNVCN